MGYTNYWLPKKLKMDEIPAQFWKDAEEILDIIISKGVVLADVHGEDRYATGKEIIENSKQYEKEEEGPCIFFNGYNNPDGYDESYETFGLSFNGVWSFCKTAREPYDIAVKCMLMLADEYNLLKPDTDDGHTWSFDGNKEESEFTDAAEIMTVFNIKHNN